MDDKDIDLDTSWIDETKKLLSVDKNYDKEPLEFITLQFCYVNNNEIQKIITEKHVFNDKTNTSLGSDFLNTLINTKSELNGLKYNCTSVSTFFVNLEPDLIQHFAKTNAHYDFFNKNIDITKDLVCPPSIFVFHSLNSVFFVFEEIPPIALVPRSILKCNQSKNKIATKKRVSFQNKTCKLR